MRLDQYLANAATELSRKEAKKVVSAGRVMVNEETCRQANRQVEAKQSVHLDGKPVTIPGDIYLMMHKPAGVLSATTDSRQPTALDLLPRNLASRVHMAGRLDKDTTGLLLLTSDGQWSHAVTSPRRECRKSYRVWLAEAIPDEACRALEKGVMLNGETTATRPAEVRVHSDKVIDLTISEGRYHRVEALHRFRIGSIELDDNLAPGEFRALTPQEIRSVTE
jgi:16S rRNA pseudouridine516 synthase